MKYGGKRAWVGRRRENGSNVERRREKRMKKKTKKMKNVCVCVGGVNK